MPALRVAAILGLIFSLPAFAETPTPVLEAVVQANRMLGRGHAGEAVKILERHLAAADGDTAYHETLRAAYAAEMKELTDPAAVQLVRNKLAALGTSLPLPALPGEAEPPKPQDIDLLKQATALFDQAAANQPAKYGSARDLFLKAFNNKVQMNAEQTAAWSICRVKVAGERLNKNSDAATAQEVVKEVTEAMAAAPENRELQAMGTSLLTAAKNRTGESILETDSFRVKFRGDKALAENIARAVEAKRSATFTRWSGPPGGAWNPKCEIVLHDSAESFNQATKLDVNATGRAEAILAEGRVTGRRIDLRADDATVMENSLPRELTHIVLADLFPSQRPPRWAELGMAVLASSDGEVHRYLRTMPRIAGGRDWVTAGKLVGASEVPATNVTAFHVESVSLVEFLVRWQGEKAFTAFLRDAQRYGVESAFKRQYGVKDFQQLETEWKKNVLSGE